MVPWFYWQNMVWNMELGISVQWLKPSELQLRLRWAFVFILEIIWSLGSLFHWEKKTLSQFFLSAICFEEKLYQVSKKPLKYVMCKVQKQHSRDIPSKSCSENMQQIYRRTTMPKCDFNKVACNFIEITLWH